MKYLITSRTDMGEETVPVQTVNSEQQHTKVSEENIQSEKLCEPNKDIETEWVSVELEDCQCLNKT